MKRALLVGAAVIVLAALATIYLFWWAPGPKRGPHDIIVKEGHDRSKWERTMTVPMRFNRLVLLQPHYWHTSGAGFGNSVEDGRLVYLMFFARAPS